MTLPTCMRASCQTTTTLKRDCADGKVNQAWIQTRVAIRFYTNNNEPGAVSARAALLTIINTYQPVEAVEQIGRG